MTPAAIFGAFGLLTILPLPARVTARPIAGASAAFPLVGAVVAVIVAGLDALLRAVLPIAVVAAIDLLVLAVLTGGLHLDGLTDTADALGAGPDRAHRLAAMRDSRIGTFGAVALVVVLLVEYAALSTIVDPFRVAAFVVALTLSRWSMSFAVWRADLARPDGIGAAFARGTRTSDALIASAIALVTLAALMPLGAAALAVGVALACTMALVSLAHHAFGGSSGDTYGAIAEIVLASELVLFAARGS